MIPLPQTTEPVNCAFSLQHAGGNLWVVELVKYQGMTIIEKRALTSPDTKELAIGQLRHFVFRLAVDGKLPPIRETAHV